MADLGKVHALCAQESMRLHEYLLPHVLLEGQRHTCFHVLLSVLPEVQGSHLHVPYSVVES